MKPYKISAEYVKELEEIVEVVTRDAKIEGYQEGYDDGHQEGYDAGWREGYQNGHEEGWEDHATGQGQ